MSAPSPGELPTAGRGSRVADRSLAAACATHGDGRKRGGQEARTVSWSGSKRKVQTASEREQQEQREQTRGARGKRGCNTATWTLLDAPSSERLLVRKPAYSSLLQIHSCYVMPPCASSRTPGRSSSSAVGSTPSFFLLPRRLCGAPQFSFPKDDHLLPRSCDAISRASPSAPLCVLSSASERS